jgi:hypothetical protein
MRPLYIRDYQAAGFDPIAWAEQRHYDVQQLLGQALAELRYRLLRQTASDRELAKCIMLGSDQQRAITLSHVARLRQVPTTQVDNLVALRRALGLPDQPPEPESSKGWTTEEFRWLIDTSRKA